MYWISLFLLPLAELTDLHFGFICLIYLAGLLFLFVEIFVPGGILGTIGLSLIIGTIVTAFWKYPGNPWYGVSLLGVTVIALPTMAIWILRRITLSSAQNLEEGFTSVDESLHDLVGQEGVAATALRPTGMATIGGKRIDVTAENIMLDKDTPVKVIQVKGNRVVVKTIGSAPSQEDS